jgi:CheY-like chemotaxis protein
MPQPHHVLLVDDHPDVRTILSRLLVELWPDAIVAEAGDGAEALESFAQQRPDLLIADYAMPVMDGIELIQALRLGGEQLPIMMISSDQTIAVTALRAGADAFLAKPFRLATLRQQLQVLIREEKETRAYGL